MLAVRVIVAIAFMMLWRSPVHADDIVLSFVYKNERIDVPASALRKIHAHASRTFLMGEERRRVEYPIASVEVCYSRPVQRQMCELTRRIQGEPLDILIGCGVVYTPIVREPICGRCLDLSALDAADAKSLAEKLRGKSQKACPATS